jgi:hypothetical protein
MAFQPIRQQKRVVYGHRPVTDLRFEVNPHLITYRVMFGLYRCCRAHTDTLAVVHLRRPVRLTEDAPLLPQMNDSGADAPGRTTDVFGHGGSGHRGVPANQKLILFRGEEA